MLLAIMMILLFDNMSEDQANLFGLVLTSSGIPNWVNLTQDIWQLWVDPADREKAIVAIHRYLVENQEGGVPGGHTRSFGTRTLSGIWVSLGLLGWHVFLKTINDIPKLYRTYESSAVHILHGQLYRTATSLMLHADTLHLAGNMAGIALFGTAVCRLTGWGVGWLLILLTGVLGNLLNAFFYSSTGHFSIGASTAVFGGLGILCGLQFIRKMKLKETKTKLWVPLAAGLALLGFLGTGQRADLMAHLLGFLSGIVLGLLYAILAKENAYLKTRYQVLCLFGTLAIIVTAWVSPLMGG